ncbi:MAG: penicillin-binding protein 1C [candidate division KSB1 bacterium]|nr:penicillin-binding protein 1C [candidate division KSB1 bacterium]
MTKKSLDIRRISAPKIFTLLIIIFIWLLIPPAPFSDISYSRIVTDRQNNMLRVTLAKDEQYRFPPDSLDLPEKYVRAVLTFEDKRFFSHHGIDPLALLNAVRINLQSGRIVRGGSTLSMQIARLDHPKPRTLFNKLRECLTALKLSLHFSKHDQLILYAAHVPMGGNTVGLQAASLRYFDKPPRDLTWAEAALFAVLPNSPSMINLDRQRSRLLQKRNHLLQRLYRTHRLDSLSCHLACREPLPRLPERMVFKAPHLCTQALAQESGHRICTTLDSDIQHQLNLILDSYAGFFSTHGIRNYAALVAETATGRVRGYVGSQGFFKLPGGQVDGVQAARSTGSLLKPFLAACAMDRGPYTLTTKLPDVPAFFGNFSPQNASGTCHGLVSLDIMLRYSLNIPAVFLLQDYGMDRFYYNLTDAGLTSLNRSPEEYGLSLILGGAEASLWECCGLFASLGNLGRSTPLRWNAEPQHPAAAVCSPGAAWLTLQALATVDRPGTEFYWPFFNNQIPVAWKTGTSYGQRDAWAIGVNSQYVIGVWAGHFSGQGNTDLYGSSAAGPVLFKLFNQLCRSNQPLWPEKPESDLRLKAVCPVSGLSPSPWCPDTIRVEAPAVAWESKTCSFHKRYILDSNGYQVCSQCWTPSDTVWCTRTIYPPPVRQLMQRQNRMVESPPRHHPDCPAVHRERQFAIEYPIPDIRIQIPRTFSGTFEPVIFKAKHATPSMHLFWYLNGSFLAETREPHNVKVNLPAGEHQLTVQDQTGAVRRVRFQAFR